MNSNNKTNKSGRNVTGDRGGSPTPTPLLTDRLTQARAQYAHEWGAGNSQQFDMQGHYTWMAGFLKDRRHVLEIGTGSGSGTLALLSAGHIVVSIDENPECLKVAGQKLNTAGHAVTYESRETIEAGLQGYRVHYRQPGSAIPATGALLLEGDILNDPGLLDWIGQHRPDAIACWLIGTYFERTRNEAIAGLAIAGPGDYRLRVHRALGQLADKILPPGGLLHLVDRGSPPDSEAAMQQHRNYHAHICVGTTLRTLTVDYIRYVEPAGSDIPAIRLTDGTTGPGPTTTPGDTSFISVVFRKE